MRLKESEIYSLMQVFRSFGLLPACKVLLFGSRIDEMKRGGDIDLLLVCPETLYSSILEKKFRIKAELEFAVGEQRVDLTLATPQKLESDPFLVSIRPSAIEISI